MNTPLWGGVGWVGRSLYKCAYATICLGALSLIELMFVLIKHCTYCLAKKILEISASTSSCRVKDMLTEYDTILYQLINASKFGLSSLIFFMTKDSTVLPMSLETILMCWNRCSQNSNHWSSVGNSFISIFCQILLYLIFHDATQCSASLQMRLTDTQTFSHPHQDQFSSKFHAHIWVAHSQFLHCK